MLVLKTYYLSEIERYRTEQEVLKADIKIRENELLSMDDTELMELHSKVTDLVLA
ncbi:hypothetical protein V1498_02500 [Peribacillus sp. SCS-26]|uniref:hypothetical protein n=1 Tax=Paraperibacillus marinus TaxID=3115295 RepID=UPI0039058056